MSNSDKIYVTSVAVATAGNVDSGKSTFIGVLVHDELDDGRGSARKKVAVHKHEETLGKTSAISTNGVVINDNAVTLVDIPGHEKYLHTATFGLTARFVDYGFLIVSPCNGITKMTKEHLALLLYHNIPMVIVVTHIDMVPRHQYDTTIKNIDMLLNKAAGGKVICIHHINDWNDHELFNKQDLTNDDKTYIEKRKTYAITNIIKSLTNLTNGKQNDYSVISISNKTGFYFDVIREIYGLLQPRPFWNIININDNKIVRYFKSKIHDSTLFKDYVPFNGTVFYIDKEFNPPGIGLVISGIARGNQIKKNGKLYLGPFGKEFYEFNVKSMHNDLRQDIQLLDDHHRGCIAIGSIKADIKRENFRKGLVAISSNLVNNICYHFDAAILLFQKSLTLKIGYTPDIHAHTIKQTARVTHIYNNTGLYTIGDNDETHIDTTTLKPGEVGVVTFKFKYRPEFLEPYTLFAFRSGEIQGIGLVLNIKLVSDDHDAKPDHLRRKNIKRTFKKPTGMLKINNK